MKSGFVFPIRRHHLNALGALLYAQGDLAGARPCYERALQIFRLRLGQEHLFTQTLQANLETLDTAA